MLELALVLELTFRTSVGYNGIQANDNCTFPVISASGRLVGFNSWATNLVPNDNNGVAFTDAFVRDLATGKIELVSLSSNGTQGDKGSSVDSISANDRYVSFFSGATNMVSGDTNGVGDVFLRDLFLGTTERVSVANNGDQANDVSAYSSVSADGRYVAFSSSATNLVEKDTNGWEDVFVRDRWLRTTVRVSVSATGEQGNLYSTRPIITPDGRYVAFESTASNLVAGDTNHRQDVFVKDLWTDAIERVSLASDGTQGNGESYLGAITPDGRFISFYSNASNLVLGDTNRVGDVFVRDRRLGTTTRVSVRSDGGQGNHGGGFNQITWDGRYVVFNSGSTNLTDDDDANGTASDVFMHDMWTGETWRISNNTQGEQGNDASGYPSISANGRITAFASIATNLAANDTNGKNDVFVHVNGRIFGR